MKNLADYRHNRPGWGASRRVHRGWMNIHVFKRGAMACDFPCINDIVEGMIRVFDCSPGFDKETPNSAANRAPRRATNIGNGQPVDLMTHVEPLEKTAGKSALKNLLPLQDGDVPVMTAEEGIGRFDAWSRSHYGV